MLLGCIFCSGVFGECVEAYEVFGDSWMFDREERGYVKAKFDSGYMPRTESG
jgi:hypothetical protein